MARFYVAATPQKRLFQWVEADSPELAISKAMAAPNDWTHSTLHGEEWALSATRHEIPDNLFPAADKAPEPAIGEPGWRDG